MKKFLRVFSLVFTLLAISLVFTACQKTQEELLLEMEEADRADELGRLIDEALEAKSSYKIVMTGKLETMLENKRMVESSRTVIAYLNADTENFIYQEKTEYTATYDSEEIEKVSIKGYQDDFMYIYSDNNGEKTGFKSLMIKDDYKNHMKSLKNESEAKIDKNGCQRVTAVKNDDGTWTATYSSFTEENLKLMLKDLGKPDIYFDENYEITDIVVSFVADSEFNLKSMNMEFVFEKIASNDNVSQISEDDSFMPVFTASYTAEYGENLSVSEEIDLNSTRYKSVVDLRCFDIVKKELDKIKQADDASAELIMKQQVSLKNQQSNYNETYSIKYNIQDGKVEYSVEGDTSEDDYYKIVYENGEQKIFDEDGRNRGTEKQSNIQSMVFLESLLDPVGFDIDIMRNVEKKGDGTYKFTLKPDESKYEEVAETYGGSLSATAYLTVEMKDGKITSYMYEMVVSIYIPSISSNMKIVEQNRCTYTY